MEYEAEFEQTFIKRTLELVNGYSKQYDATLLINCLLGLLVIPKERYIEKIPLDPIANLEQWGISPSSIKSPGKKTGNNNDPKTFRGVIQNLRNAVAHFQVSPVHKDQKVSGFQFQTHSGFDAELQLSEIKALVKHLSDCVKSQD